MEGLLKYLPAALSKCIAHTHRTHGALTQGEKGLCRALLRAHSSNMQDLLQRHVAAAAGHRRLRECAVAALVPAQPDQRDEHLQGMQLHTESRAPVGSFAYSGSIAQV